MPFDINSAVELQEDQKSIPTTSFDISSAQEINPPAPEKPPSPISKFLRNIFRDSPIEQIQTQLDLTAQSKNLPQVKDGESFASYIKRFRDTSLTQREDAIAREGVVRQLEVPMTGAIAATGMGAPAKTIAAVGSFSIADHFFNARRWIEDKAPDTSPIIKDVVEIVDFIAKGAIIGAGFEGIKRFSKDRMDKLNTPKSVVIPPEQVSAIKTEPAITETLGITPEHIAASENSVTPISVPVERVLDLAKSPKWEEIKPLLGGESGEKIQGKIGKEKVLNPSDVSTPSAGAEPVSKPPVTSRELAQDNAQSSKAALQSAINLRNEALAEKNTEKAAKAQALIDKISKPTAEKVYPSENVTKVSSEQLPVGEGVQKASALESRVKQSIESAPESIKTDISNYKEMNKKEQIAAASKYVISNPEEALAVLKGEKAAPKGLLHNSIALALEEHAATANDANLVLKLASLRSTRAGQEISILTERNPNSPITYIDELAQRKIESLGDKEAATKIREKNINEARKYIKKPSKGDWTAFVESIRC